jgi:hypothetical protein
VPFDTITSKNAVLASGYFRTHGVMSSVYYRNSSRNSWQDAAHGLPRAPYGLTYWDCTQSTPAVRTCMARFGPLVSSVAC